MSQVRKILLDHAFECVNDAGEFEPPTSVLKLVVQHLAKTDALFVGDAINGDVMFERRLVKAAISASPQYNDMAIAVARGLFFEAALHACQPFERDVMAYIQNPERPHND